MDLVVNTVPDAQAISSDLYPLLGGKTVVDISSPPGGLDHLAARETGVTVIWARAQAGERAPLTVGESQCAFIRRMMSNDGTANVGDLEALVVGSPLPDVSDSGKID
jgi:dipicolinate synthase subunit A